MHKKGNNHLAQNSEHTQIHTHTFIFFATLLDKNIVEYLESSMYRDDKYIQITIIRKKMMKNISAKIRYCGSSKGEITSELLARRGI